MVTRSLDIRKFSLLSLSVVFERVLTSLRPFLSNSVLLHRRFRKVDLEFFFSISVSPSLSHPSSEDQHGSCRAHPTFSRSLVRIWLCFSPVYFIRFLPCRV